jgi:hypothetical protein
MPPRWLTVAIVVCWLATAAWFFQHDLWPRLRPGQRPPYTLDLAHEVTGPNNPRHWDVFYKGKTIGNARTWVEYRREDDTFKLHSRFVFHDFIVAVLHVQFMESTYRVTRDGRLREVDGQVDASRDEKEKEKGPPQLRVHVHGHVEDGVFRPHWVAESPMLPGGKQELDSEPVAVADNHSVLSPMQPWNRLRDLQVNRKWQIELFDPLMGSVSNLVPGLGTGVSVRTLEAGVREETESRIWNNQEVTCLVVEYHGEGVTGRTYVRQSDGLVLRQEAIRNEGTPDEETLALERKPQ